MNWFSSQVFDIEVNRGHVKVRLYPDKSTAKESFSPAQTPQKCPCITTPASGHLWFIHHNQYYCNYERRPHWQRENLDTYRQKAHAS